MEKFFTRVCGCMVAAVLMVAMSAQAFATSKTVSVTEAGTLSTLIPASEKNAITSLTVSGTLNGTDIRFIREMAGLDIEGETTDGKLTELNIAGIELTDGGDAYYEDAWSKYYTATSYDVSEDNDLYYCTDLSYAFTGTKLDKAAFDGCSSLTEITLPKKLKTLGEAVFEGCTALEAINVAEGNASFASADGVLFNKAKTNLLAFPAGKTGAYAVPSGTEEIAASAFSRCVGLSAITLPETLTTIGDEVFYRCTGLTKLTLPNSVTSIGESFVYRSSALKSVTLGSGMNTVGESMFYYANGLESIDVPEGYTSIGYEAFASCSALKSVTLPSTIGAIAAEAFYGCSALESFTIKVAAPIAITADVFEDVDLNTCVLNVPEEGVEAYKADAQWGKFKNINGIMPSGVNDVVSSIDASVSVADGVLTIDGAKSDISVYNIGGVRLANGSVRLSVTLSEGVYIVTLNGKATKVIVK